MLPDGVVDGELDVVPIGVVVGEPELDGVFDGVCELDGVKLGDAVTDGVNEGVRDVVGTGVADMDGQGGSPASPPGTRGNPLVIRSPEPSSQKKRHRCETERPDAGMGEETMAPEPGEIVHTLPAA